MLDLNTAVESDATVCASGPLAFLAENNQR